MTVNPVSHNTARDGADQLGVDPPVAWPASSELTVAAVREAFADPGRFSVGVEEELMLLDPVTLDVAPRSDEIVRRLGGDSRFQRELLAAQLEIVTPVLASASEATACLAAARGDLARELAGETLIAGAGVHPCSTHAAVVTPAARYEAQEREYRWAVTGCGQTFGLHVHVAVPGPER